MAYDEIRDCPNCGKLVYDRCDCGWKREEYSGILPVMSVIFIVGIFLVLGYFVYD